MPRPLRRSLFSVFLFFTSLVGTGYILAGAVCVSLFNCLGRARFLTSRPVVSCLWKSLFAGLLGSH